MTRKPESRLVTDDLMDALLGSGQRQDQARAAKEMVRAASTSILAAAETRDCNGVDVRVKRTRSTIRIELVAEGRIAVKAAPDLAPGHCELVDVEASPSELRRMLAKLPVPHAAAA